ncbi:MULTISPECIES: 4-hydroxy-tetrahydrodipicolinate reductase [unclassified Fusibacter]|uniref:4-hydroxy-tetrahydrodipicolinate reductase n=1 Tax=unclassified Fusibacter TaxID=2624464 RepID=UPI00101034AF|nr:MULTISPECIES: 4-hydroxy-tetrahydrodipicolinate reductase [unclassified Fusibacter]MCK8058691.1 4-hydroxy-tetrahydrodipicolinate reductase [Fusibacter sp. A2]NPE21765.1 4-hydroxy-tetrahydrodipicolinate reductase [Fusibacter sp. A1]RXV61339.1 4-hydroxy-tetrahydrodipicolinate reductase [Fusibacter sp. A1]
MNILLNGCTGTMGKVVEGLVKEDEAATITVGTDLRHAACDYPVYQSFDLVVSTFDVIIDFSHHSMVDALIAFALKMNRPAVICTTGLSQQTIRLIDEASKKIPVFRSANMSYGINLIESILEEYAALMTDSFDVEIIEKHHNRKEDAPSGTALMLADAVHRATDHRLHNTYGRHGNQAKRLPLELGIHAVRGGTLVGEHEVIFAGCEEDITIKHQAQSRAVFARGALRAAHFLMNKEPGLYTMHDLIKEDKNARI